MDNAIDPSCLQCDKAPHNLEHWLGCPGTLQAWLDIVGSTKPLALSTPSAFPAKLVTLARPTF